MNPFLSPQLKKFWKIQLKSCRWASFNAWLLDSSSILFSKELSSKNWFYILYTFNPSPHTHSTHTFSNQFCSGHFRSKPMNLESVPRSRAEQLGTCSVVP